MAFALKMPLGVESIRIEPWRLRSPSCKVTTSPSARLIFGVNDTRATVAEPANFGLKEIFVELVKDPTL